MTDTNPAFKFGTGALTLGNSGAGPLAVNTVPDPLANVEYTGDLEKDSKAELDALQIAYRARAADEAQRRRAATDTEFWFAVCFLSREEKDAFLNRHNLTAVGDKYLDGRAVDHVLEQNGKEGI